MLPSYESPLRFQEGWSSLQTHSRTPRNPPRGLTLQMGMLGNLKARTALRMCSKNLQLAPNCGTWVRNHRLFWFHPAIGTTSGFTSPNKVPSTVYSCSSAARVLHVQVTYNYRRPPCKLPLFRRPARNQVF